MRNVYIFLVILTLAGCAPKLTTFEKAFNENNIIKTPLAIQAQKITKAERKKSKSQVSSWILNGAMAARSSKKAWSARINWLQKGSNNYQLRLFGPMNSKTIIITKRGSSVTVRDGSKISKAQDPEQLLQAKTGMRLPVGNLYYWARALPAPGSKALKKFDSVNHLTELKQNGYVINYANYQTVKGYDLPGKIKLRGHGLSLKLIIKNWRI